MSNNQIWELAKWVSDVAGRYDSSVMRIILELTQEADKLLDLELAKIAVISKLASEVIN